MSPSRAAATVTWAYAAMFGLPAVPVAVFLADHGRLPTLWGLFPMYGGPWSATYGDERVVALLLAFLALTLAASATGWLLWTHRRGGRVVNLALLPAEAVFWIGFALPLPWLLGAARVVLVGRAGRSRMEPPVGIEPTTYSLRVNRSTD